MVCLSNEGTVVAIVIDTIGAGSKKRSTIRLSPSKLVSRVIEEIGRDFNYKPDEFQLLLKNKVGGLSTLNKFKNNRLIDAGVAFDQEIRNTLIIKGNNKNENKEELIKSSSSFDISDVQTNERVFWTNDCSKNMNRESSAITANESTATSDYKKDSSTPAVMSIDDYFLKYSPNNVLTTSQELPSSSNSSCKYVGLVNQAMTCYLNSLLQALYMTPEFRNALYNWEFDGQNTATSIPFQLQKLFLNLQTSSKSAVETTELTKSFGWDLSEAWQQHDIQELCRVMFDALEQKFKDTEQANLINALYEGKMLDYVKCLECGTEKSREDTFLDIPLPVRPFGSNVAYNSVMEALRAFVQPETLDGNNQYFCEKCNKKCNAHKGLKFTKFPYLLTLHLKRFDFDYSTMHRIKLNDKVVFKEILNLNSFIASSGMPFENGTTEDMEERETIVKCDDSSTTDSGSALDDESCQGTDISSTVNGPDDNCQDEDEGIDVSSLGNNQDSEKTRHQEPSGPYVYELFSIMIHSGSASGGHYYAYIKDFSKNKWYCFNDQTVTRITEEDIKKTYGGGPTRGYYSGAYSSSTNAYMLMYRQIDKERNCTAMTAEQFPPHIKKLLQQMREKEEFDRAAKERESEMCRLRVFCYHPDKNQLMQAKVFCTVDTYLSEAAKDAHTVLKLDGIIPMKDCRLVTFNKRQETIECSFDEDLKFCDIPSMNMSHSDTWLLEYKEPGIDFQTYKPGGVTMKLFLVNLEDEEIDESINFRVHADETVRDVQTRLAKMLNMNVNNIKVVLETYIDEPRYLDQPDEVMKFDPTVNRYKLYVANALDDDPEKSFAESKLYRIIDQFAYVVTINVQLPDIDNRTLDFLSIPPLDLNLNSEKIDITACGDNRSNESPQPGATASGSACEPFGDQSNSEDSSLSDSDRTLVGEAPGDCIGILSGSSNSPADQHMSSPNDPTEDMYNHEVFTHPAEEMNWDDEEIPENTSNQLCSNYYFRVKMKNGNRSGSGCVSTNGDSDNTRWCRVQVDKRMSLGRFKKYMEPVVGVSVDYFKVYQLYPNEIEWTRLSDTLGSLKCNDTIMIKLGRVLKKDEFGGKVYRLNLENSNDPFEFLFEWIVAKGQTVASAKKEIIMAAKKQHMLDLNYYTCRLRKKNWKTPGKVFLDDQRFGKDIIITKMWEIFIQDLGEPERVTDPSQLCLFVRRWCPSTLKLLPLQEIVLNEPTMAELKDKLAEESLIPREFIDIAYPKQNFPCDMNVLELSTTLYWNPEVTTLDRWPIPANEDGSVLFYRDSRETLKEITPQERAEIDKIENARLGKFSSKMAYSLRRERALKIYLDPSNKSEEACTD